MADTQTLPNVNFNPSPQQVDNFMGYVLWALIGLIALVVIGFVIWKIWQRMSYKMTANLHRKVGNNVLVEPQSVRKVYTNDGKYMYHYIPINKKSPIFEDRYNKLMKRPAWFGLMQKTVIGFDAYVKDGKIIPMDYNQNYVNGQAVEVSLTGVDYDMTNFIKMELDDYYLKKQKNSALMQLMPYIALLLVIMAWIIGMVLYTKHVETIAHDILNFGQTTVNTITEQIGKIQIMPGK